MKLFIYLFLCLSYCSGQGDSFYRVQYGVSLDYNNIEGDSLSARQEKFNAYNKYTANLAKDQTLILDYGNSKSIFYLKQSLDSKKAPALVYKGELYINYKDKVIRNQKEAYGDKFILVDYLPKYNWELHSDEKVINGYNCTKATTSYLSINSKGDQMIVEVEVWFTYQIPLGIGPMDYVGLPGLVIESKKGKVVYQMKSIDKLDKINITSPTKGKEVSPEEYNVIGANAVKSIFGK